MERLYILKFFAMCWVIASLATTDTPATDMAQELTFALMGTCIERTRLGQTAEATFELLDLLAA